ncbi:unnamed protein product [Toxocara canis]|uniref:Transposase n=1 Tax=Toxocara canis TaxID=6265 RepID=A0A183UMU7_TOXCA|nr:unnamed protein product [Toxocara canis]
MAKSIIDGCVVEEHREMLMKSGTVSSMTCEFVEQHQRIDARHYARPQHSQSRVKKACVVPDGRWIGSQVQNSQLHSHADRSQCIHCSPPALTTSQLIAQAYTSIRKSL